MLSRSVCVLTRSAAAGSVVGASPAAAAAAPPCARLLSTATPAPAAARSPHSPSAAATAAAVSASQILGAHTLSPRLQRLSADIAGNSQPKQNQRTGYWNKPKLLAQDRARLRKTDLLHGGIAAQFEKVHLRRIEPVVLKGKKREKVVLDRKARIAAAMVDMESRIEEHHRVERARRVRPGFFQLITGKKPSGVIAAEEAAAKERKEKNKAAERARQAAKATVV